MTRARKIEERLQKAAKVSEAFVQRRVAEEVIQDSQKQETEDYTGKHRKP